MIEVRNRKRVVFHLRRDILRLGIVQVVLDEFGHALRGEILLGRRRLSGWDRARRRIEVLFGGFFEHAAFWFTNRPGLIAFQHGHVRPGLGLVL